MKNDEQRPDAAGGIAVVFWTAVVLLFVIFVPSREGASPRGKFYVAALALIGMAWGIRQIAAAKRAQKREGDSAKGVGKQRKAEQDGSSQ